MRRPIWSVCDRCGFNYYREQLRKESYGAIVCRRCYDAAFDLKRHPQNYPAPFRLNPSIVPDGRPPLDDNTYLLQENSDPILLENGMRILVQSPPWSPPAP